MSGFSFDHLRGTFFDECAELLEVAYAQLALLSEGRADSETIHALFRAVHSIKGGGGAFGFVRVVKLAHIMENLLDHMRDGLVAMDVEKIETLLKSTDVLADLLAAERKNVAAAEGIESALIESLTRASALETITPASAKHDVENIGQAKAWHVKFAPHPNMLQNGNEPLYLIRELRKFGALTIDSDLSRVPPLEELEAENAYIEWSFTLQADVTRAAIEEIFEFVVDDCELAIVPLEAERQDEGPMVAEVASADRSASSSEDRSAPTKESPSGSRPSTTQSIRVDVAKVDRIVNLVGELVINQSMLVQLGTQLPPGMCPGLNAGLETLSQHLRELQEGVMAIRTQPVKTVFGRMPRLVRELASQLGKDVRLEVSGEATEIDKTVVEQLVDPLTHLLRNALDHGLESSDERVAAGKTAQGLIRLSAEQRGGRIIIELSDDGRGINRAKVLERARDRGLIEPDAALSDAEIDELIFKPGFSTASLVSAVSGRGVGMDVVRRNITSLGGRVSITSRDGEGSRFSLSLPLTLAVMDGLVVSVGAEIYVVPLTAIVESLRPHAKNINTIYGGGQVLSARGQFIPLLCLAQRFGVKNALTDASRGIVVIVETDNSDRLAIMVDDLVGQQQIVVKNLEENYDHIPGVAGATILGDGRVALILDVVSLAAKNFNENGVENVKRPIGKEWLQ